MNFLLPILSLVTLPENRNPALEFYASNLGLFETERSERLVEVLEVDQQVAPSTSHVKI